MKYNPEIHHRRSIRLKGYDYSQPGAYFITICTHQRECLFGDIVDGKMILNENGRIVSAEWIKTAEIRNEIELDQWVVMPNHFHGIMVINGMGNDIGRGNRLVAPTNGPQPRSIGAVMAGFKSSVTKQINEMCRTPGEKVWQRNYWEHIIRNDVEFKRIQQYIQNNPQKWDSDKMYINQIPGN